MKHQTVPTYRVWNVRRTVIKCIALVILVMIQSNCVRHTVHPVKLYGQDFVVPNSARDGIYYSLPKTVVRFSFPFTKVTYKPGPLAAYATVVGFELPPATLEDWVLISTSESKDSIAADHQTAAQLSRLLSELSSEAVVIDALCDSGDAEKKSTKEQIKSFSGKLATAKSLWKQLPEKRLENLQLKPISRFAMGSPFISTSAIPDPDHAFIVKVKGSWDEDRKLMLALSNAGLISSTESSARSRVPEYAAEVIRTGLQVASALYGGTIPAAPAATESEGPALEFTSSDPCESIRKEVTELKDLIGNFHAKYGLPLQYKEAFDKLRVARAKLLTEKQASVNPLIFDKQLAEIDEALLAIQKVFFTTEALAWTGTYALSPDSQKTFPKDAKTAPSKNSDVAHKKVLRQITKQLFSFSEQHGIFVLENKNPKNKDPKFSVHPEFRTGFNVNSKEIGIELACIPKPQYADIVRDQFLQDFSKSANGCFLAPSDYKGKQLAKRSTSFFYRVPATASATINMKSNGFTGPIVGTDVLVAQWGGISAVKDVFTSVQSRVLVEYYQDLGAIKKYEWENTAVDPQLFTRVGDAAAEFAKAYAARRAAEDAQPGRIERLQKRIEGIQNLLGLFGSPEDGGGGDGTATGTDSEPMDNGATE